MIKKTIFRRFVFAPQDHNTKMFTFCDENILFINRTFQKFSIINVDNLINDFFECLNK